MKTAISQRLDDLQAVARQLQAILDHEDAKQLLPSMLLCRMAVSVDEAVGKLEQHLEALAVHQGNAHVRPPRR
jgi:hypothetical protein